QFLALPAERPARYGAYRLAYLKKSDGDMLKTLATKAVVESFPGILGILQGEAERLIRLDSKLRALRVAASTAALLRLGAEMLALYARVKESRALLDYDDLILATRDLLQGGEGVAAGALCKLDGGIDHVLSGGAQDTNPGPRELLEP